jgi:hypothetical protein
LLEAAVLVAATATKARTRAWRRRRDILWWGAGASGTARKGTRTGRTYCLTVCVCRRSKKK